VLRQLTTQKVMVVTLFALLTAFVTTPSIDTDTWWHIRSGADTLTNGIVQADTYSHTITGRAWLNHSWGAQVILYGLYAALGNWGLVLYTGALALGGMALLFASSEGGVYLRAFVVTLASATAVVFWSPRPQMLSFFLSALVMVLLLRYKRGKRGLFWFPLMMVLWGNLHAGFAIGFILLGGFFAGELVARLVNADGEGVLSWGQLRWIVWMGLAGAAVLVLNPFTYRLYLIPFQTVGVDVLRAYIQEWQPPDFQNLQLLPFVLLIITSLGAVGASRGRLYWSEFVLWSGTLYMALVASRNVALFAVVATPIVLRHLASVDALQGQPARRRVSPRMGLVNAVLIGVIVLGVSVKAWVSLSPEAVQAQQSLYLPTAAVDYLQREEMTGTLYNSYNWGGYLIFSLPDVPVFVDGRTDLYGNDFLTAYLQVYLAQSDWQDILASYDVDLVLVEGHSPLAQQLQLDSGWEQRYQDDMTVIYQRMQ
jgi:hypothetical protein